jgi:hypothetical protein
MEGGMEEGRRDGGIVAPAPEVGAKAVLGHSVFLTRARVGAGADAEVLGCCFRLSNALVAKVAFIVRLSAPEVEGFGFRSRP